MWLLQAAMTDLLAKYRNEIGCIAFVHLTRTCKTLHSALPSLTHAARAFIRALLVGAHPYASPWAERLCVVHLTNNTLCIRKLCGKKQSAVACIVNQGDINLQWANQEHSLVIELTEMEEITASACTYGNFCGQVHFEAKMVVTNLLNGRVASTYTAVCSVAAWNVIPNAIAMC